MAAVRRDDARLVDHLVLEREPARPLHDAAAGVVDLRCDRLQNPGADAAVVVAAIGGPLGFNAIQLATASGLSLLTLFCRSLGSWRQCRNPSVRRVDDIRGHAANGPGALEPMRRRRYGATDGPEFLLELLSALQRELIAVVVRHILVALRDAL